MFFIFLAVTFGAAVYLRLRAYDPVTLATPGPMPAGTADATGSSGVPENAETMTIESLPADGAPATTGNGVSAREQRYNELLRSGPPAAQAQAAPAAEDKPSLLGRVVAPIANALGIGKPAAPQPAAATPPRGQPQPKPEEPQTDRGSSSEKGNEPREQTETDPDSDTVPPQLLSVEFMPPQVQDGETTTLAVMATDNLSGVRSVSGVIASPTNASQGFACQREGESNRYIARVSVPREAAEGVWAVRYITLTDQASNSTNITQASGGLPMSASFRVTSSRPDAAGPVLRSVWLAQNSMNAGERNTVFVQAEDEKSGVNTVSGVFVSPTKQARLGFGCKLGTTGAWECPLAPPACVDCGAWQLEQIQMQDKANNMVTVRIDNPVVAPVQVTITGDKCDGTAPTLTSLALDPPVVSNAETSLIRVMATVNDDNCGAASLSGQAVGPGGPAAARLYFSFAPSPDGQNFTGTITVPKHAAKGMWTIAWIQVLDKGHNLKAYAANDPIVARVTFRVE